MIGMTCVSHLVGCGVHPRGTCFAGVGVLSCPEINYDFLGVDVAKKALFFWRLFLFSLGHASADYFTVAGNVGCLVSDRVILSVPSHPERTEPPRRPSCPDVPLKIS